MLLNVILKNVILLNTIQLNAILFSIVLLTVILLNVTLLNGILPNAILLNTVAPFYDLNLTRKLSKKEEKIFFVAIITNGLLVFPQKKLALPQLKKFLCHFYFSSKQKYEYGNISTTFEPALEILVSSFLPSPDESHLT
jgi:hypothetical protein